MFSFNYCVAVRQGQCFVVLFLDVRCMFMLHIELFSNGRKEEMFYLMTHFNIFDLLRGVRHMIKDHRDNERKSTATSWATLSDWQQQTFYMHHFKDRIAHTMAFVIREVAMCFHQVRPVP